jgi:hypothetical protein
MTSLRRCILGAIGRPNPTLKSPSADAPRAGYMSYTMRLLLGEGKPKAADPNKPRGSEPKRRESG